MSYKIKLGTVNKYVESTARPDVSAWKEYDITLKDGADVVNPTITLSIDFETVKNFNYAFMLNRYYWIVKKTMLRAGLCVLDLECDVLATYKSEIGDSELYILRSSAASDGYVVDRLYPLTNELTKYYDVPSGEILTGFSSGVYVVQIAGKNTGSSTLYEMTPTNFSNFIHDLLGVYDSLDWSSVENSLQSAVFDPMKYIYSVRWYPSAFGGTPVSNIFIGYWSSNVNARRINDPFKVAKSFTLSLRNHPQIARGKFLNGAPYRKMELYLPPFGIIPIDTNKLIDSASLYVAIYVDALTGSATAYGRDENGQKLFSVSGQWGVNLPITQGGAQGGNFIGQALTTIGGTLLAGASGGASLALGAGVAAIGEAAQMFDASPSSTGSQGTILAFQDYSSLATYCNHIVDEDNTRNGRPYCKIAKPANLGGYMIASRGDVHINGTLPEEEKIRAFLESGFYYE